MGTSDSKKDRGIHAPAFSDSELENIRQILLDKRQSITVSRENHLNELSDPTEKHHLADLEEMASDTNEARSLCEIMDIGEATVAQIDVALERIADGTYGVCGKCEQPIPRARIEALPFADLCVGCQRERELHPEL